jgi:hypothetical protein
MASFPSLPFSISVAASLEKSKLASTDAWLALAKVTWPDSTVTRLVCNTDNVSYDCGDGAGVQVYEAFAWQFGELQEQTDGSIPSLNVMVSNTLRVLESYLEAQGGGVGGSLSIYIVQASKLQREPDLELDFGIVGSKSDFRWVTFKLGAESPLRILFGRHPYSADTCCFRYMGEQCAYAGTVATAATTSGNSQITLATATGITTADMWGVTYVQTGASVSGAGIPAGTLLGTRHVGGICDLVDVNGNPVNATATASAASLTFTLPQCSLQMNGPVGCRAHNNVIRFGADPGIDSNGLRAVSK